MFLFPLQDEMPLTGGVDVDLNSLDPSPIDPEYKKEEAKELSRLGEMHAVRCNTIGMHEPLATLIWHQGDPPSFDAKGPSVSFIKIVFIVQIPKQMDEILP